MIVKPRKILYPLQITSTIKHKKIQSLNNNHIHKSKSTNIILFSFIYVFHT